MKDNRRLNIALYIRVANKENFINKHNINHQINLLINYVKKHYSNYKYKFYIDNGYSGISYDRPNFKKLKQDICKKKIDIIVCEDISRITRENSFFYFNSFIKENDVQLVTVQNSDDKNFFENNFNLFERIIKEYSNTLIKDRKRCLEEEIKNKV